MERELDIIDGTANRKGTIVKCVHRDRSRQLCLQSWQQRFDAIHHLDNIGSGLFGNRKLDGTHTFRRVRVVIPRSVVRILNAVDNAPKISQPYGRSIAISDDQLSVIGCIEELSRCLQSDRSLRPPEHTRGQIDIPITECSIDLVDTDLPGGKLMRIQLNMDREFCRPPHLHLSDTPDGRYALRD